ncbi:hypothetical protein [Streptomyces abikoensis]
MARAIEDIREGDDPLVVLRNLVSGAWMAGHIEGEDSCPGCDVPPSHATVTASLHAALAALEGTPVRPHLSFAAPETVAMYTRP